MQPHARFAKMSIHSDTYISTGVLSGNHGSLSLQVERKAEKKTSNLSSMEHRHDKVRERKGPSELREEDEDTDR